MSDFVPVTVRVPATTANIGPGFDCLGAALTLYNSLTFSPSDAGPLTIHVRGADAERVPTEESNLAYRAFAKLFHHLDRPVPAVQMSIDMGVPLARGLGSSATAIIGGLLGANASSGSPLSTSELMELAIAIEGHPDNVVPALLGGCRLTTAQADQRWLVCDIPWHQDLVPIVAIPDFELSTAEARRVLPQQYSRADAIFNAAHVGLLVRALETGQGDWLQTALDDRIHQPYRRSLIHGFESVQAAALEAGACGLVISGAGPTLLALALSERAEAVRAAMESAWTEAGIAALAQIQDLDREGAIATPL